MPSNAPVILLTVANPLGDLPTVGEEFGTVWDTLKPTGLQVEPLPYATLEQLLKALQDHRDRTVIFHYGGHASELGLLLENKGTSALALAGGLARFLSNHKGLKLLFLNGCSTQQQISEFHQAGIPAVIGTREAIPDVGAAQFARWFYRGLASGATLEEAFKEAQATLSTSQGPTRDAVVAEWANPIPPNSAELWMLSISDPAAGDWSFAQALNDPLFGLPDLPSDISYPPNTKEKGPYKHLNWFTREDARIFFGRSQVIRDLYQRLSDPNNEYERVLLFYGQTGVGKSSVLAAGVLPRLEREFTVIYSRRDPRLGLRGTLLGKLAAHSKSLSEAWRTLEASTGKPLIVVLDQLEEVYTHPNANYPNEVADLAKELRVLFGGDRPRGRLVLSFRKEWLAEISKRLMESQAEGQPPLNLNNVFLEALDHNGLEEAIRGPAALRNYNLIIDPQDLPRTIAGRIAEDSDSAKAPTLQLVLKRLWEQAKELSPSQPRMDQALYDQVAKKGASLGEYLKDVLANPPQQLKALVDSGLALDLLEFHVTPEGTARERSWSEVVQAYGGPESEQRDPTQSGHIRDLLQFLKDRYVLTDPAGEIDGGSRLVHDTLARVVRDQFAASQLPGQRARRIVENRAVDWQDGKIGSPLEDYDLKLFEQGRGGMRNLSEDEARMVEASEKAEQARVEQLRRDAEEKERQRQVIEDEKNARLKQQARSLVVFRRFSLGLGVLVLIVMGVAWYATQKQAEAERRRIVSVAQGLSVRASSLANDPGQFTLATLLARQASLLHVRNNGDQLEQMDGQLRMLLSRPLYTSRSLHQHRAGVESMAFSPDGRWLASGSFDRMVRLWDMNDLNAEPVTLSGHQGYVISLAFNPDSNLLASGSEDTTIRLWKLNDLKAQPVILRGHDSVISSIVFSSDGSKLVSGSRDHVLNVWTMKSLQATPLTVRNYKANLIALNGNTLALGEDGNAIYLLDLYDLKKPSVQSLHPGELITSLAFSPDGHLLASGSADDNIHLWDMKYGANRKKGVLSGHFGSVISLAFSPDGTKLASGSEDKTIRLWDLDNLEAQSAILDGHKGEVRAVAFSPDGSRLASGSVDKTIRLWDLKDSKVEPMELKANSIRSLAFSPDGAKLVGGGAIPPSEQGQVIYEGDQFIDDLSDNTIFVWDLSKPETESHFLEGHRSTVVNSVAFSLDGKRLASGSGDSFSPEEHSIRIWDMSAPMTEPRVLQGGHQGWTSSVALSPDGQKVASVGRDKTLRIWDLKNTEPVSEVLMESLGDYFSMAFGPDGSLLAADVNQNKVRLWKQANLKAEPVLLTEYRSPIKFLKFNSDGSKLAFGSVDKTIHIWDLKNRPAESLVLTGLQSEVRFLAFSRDSTRLAVGDGDVIRLWDLDNPAVRPVALGKHAEVMGVAFSPDGSRLATGGYFGPVRLWRTTEALLDLACWVLIRNLSQDEWNGYVGADIPYEKTCPNLPPGDGVPGSSTSSAK